MICTATDFLDRCKQINHFSWVNSANSQFQRKWIIFVDLLKLKQFFCKKTNKRNIKENHIIFVHSQFSTTTKINNLGSPIRILVEQLISVSSFFILFAPKQSFIIFFVISQLGVFGFWFFFIFTFFSVGFGIFFLFWRVQFFSTLLHNFIFENIKTHRTKQNKKIWKNLEHQSSLSLCSHARTLSCTEHQAQYEISLFYLVLIKFHCFSIHFCLKFLFNEGIIVLKLLLPVTVVGNDIYFLFCFEILNTL